MEARPEGPTLRGLRIRADVVQILLACGLGLFAVEIITFLRSVALIDRLQRSCLAFATCSPSDQTALIDAANRDDGIRAALAFTELGFLLLTGILWLMWQHRAHRIVRRRWRRPDTRFSSAWGVGCWFVPFANLALPYQAHAELWRAADPEAGPTHWRAGRVGWLIPAWWTTWLVSGFGAFVLSRATVPVTGSSVEDIKRYLGTNAVASLLQLIAVVPALLVVRRLSRRILAADARLVWTDVPTMALPAVEGLPLPPSALGPSERVASMPGWLLAASAFVTMVAGLAAVVVAGLELPASAL